MMLYVCLGDVGVEREIRELRRLYNRTLLFHSHTSRVDVESCVTTLASRLLVATLSYRLILVSTVVLTDRLVDATRVLLAVDYYYQSYRLVVATLTCATSRLLAVVSTSSSDVEQSTTQRADGGGPVRYKRNRFSFGRGRGDAIYNTKKKSKNFPKKII